MKFDWQRLVFGPWLQNAKTDWFWDELLNAALDQHAARRIGNHTAEVGPFTVWISNWPYAYGSVYAPYKFDGLPSVATRRRLRAALQKHDFALLAYFAKGE